MANSVFGARIELKVKKSNSGQFRNEIQSFVDSATSSNPIKLKNFKLDLSRGQATTIAKQLQDAMAGAQIDVKVDKVDASGAIENLKRQLNTMMKGLTIDGMKSFVGDVDLTNGSRGGSMSKLSNEAKAARTIIDALESKLKSAAKSIADLGDVGEFSKLSTRLNDVLIKLHSIREAVGNNDVSGLEALNNEVQELIASLHTAQDVENSRSRTSNTNYTKEINQMKQVENLLSQIRTYTDNNTRAYAAYKNQFDSMTTELEKMATGGQMDPKRIAEFRLELARLKRAAEAAGISGKTLGERFKDALEKFGGWAVVTNTLSKVVTIVKKMATAVREVDTAMTELKKVTDLTAGAYDAIYLKSTKTAKEVGASISDTLTSTAEFARLGYNAQDASDLAKVALMYKNVGDGVSSATEASESLISTIKGFGLEVSDATHIVDAFNAVGNNFAISSTGIGTALQKSAAALSAAGNTMEESIGMVAAMNAVIQNPDSVGTSLKTLSMYLRAAKTEAEEAGVETDGMANSVSELRSEIMSLTGNKVDIMINDDTFKSTYQIIQELAQIWDESFMTDTNKANILEMIGGKRNANAVSALIKNFKDAQDAADTALNSMGSAFAENENYLDSINGRIQQIKTTFESTSNAVLSSDLIKFVLDVANVLLKVVETLSKIHMLIPAIVAGFGAFKAFKKSSAVNAIFEQAKSLVDASNGVDIFKESIVGLNGKQLALLSTLLKTDDKLDVFSQALATATGNSTKAGKSISGLGTIISGMFKTASKGDIIAAAVTTAIGAVIWAVDHYKKKKQEMIEAGKEIVESINEVNETYSSNVDSINKLAPRYYELTEKMNENGGAIALTASEYEEYISIVNQIGEVSPGIVSAYTDEGNALIEYTDIIKAATDAQDQWRASRLADTFSAKSSKTVFDSANASYDEAHKAIKKASNSLQGLFHSFSDAQHETIRDVLMKTAFEGMNDDDAFFNAWSISLDAMEMDPEIARKVVQNADAFMAELRSALDPNGVPLFSEEALTNISTKIYGISSAVAKADEAAQPIFEYLKSYDQYSMDVENRLSSLPDAMSSSVDTLLMSIAKDATQNGKSYIEAISDMKSASDDLYNIMDQPTTKFMSGVTEEYINGTYSVAEFNDALNALDQVLRDQQYDDLVVDAVIDYYKNMASAAESAGESIAELGIDSVEAAKKSNEAIKAAMDAAKINADAVKDMADGELGAETIYNVRSSGFADALGAFSVTDGYGNIVESYDYIEGVVRDHVSQMLEAANVDEYATEAVWKYWDALKAGEKIDELDAAMSVNSLYEDAISDISANSGTMTQQMLTAFEDGIAELEASYPDMVAPFEEYLIVDDENRVIGVFVDKLRELQQSFLETGNVADIFKTTVSDAFDAITAGKIADDAQRAYDTTSSIINAISAAQASIKEQGFIGDDVVRDFQNILGVQEMEDLSGYLEWDTNAQKYIDINADALRQHAESLYSVVEGYENLRVVQMSAFDAVAYPDAAIQYIEDLANAHEELEGVINSVSSAYSEAQENGGYISSGTAAELIRAFGSEAVGSEETADGLLHYKAVWDEIYNSAVIKLGGNKFADIIVPGFESAWAQILAGGESTFDKLLNGLDSALGNGDLISTIKDEIEESGRLSFETIADLYSQYGEAASNFISTGVHTRLTDRGVDVDRWHTVDYQQLIDYEVAALRAAGANEGLIQSYKEWIEALIAGEENVQSQFEKLTDAIDKASSYMSSAESAYKDMLDRGSLTFDSLGGLIDTFGEDWTKVVSIDELTGDFDLLTNVVKNLAVEQLKNAGASEEIVKAYEEQYDAAMKLMAEEARIAARETKFSFEAQGYSEVISAMQEAASATGMTITAIDNLKKRYEGLAGAQNLMSDLFVTTSNGISLNTVALDKLEEKYKESRIKEYDEQLEGLKAQYEAITEQIERFGGSSDVLERRRDMLLSEIQDVQTLKAQYIGLTSAYNKWMNAKSGPEEGDTYDSVVGSLEELEKLRSEGLVGTNEFQAAAEFITGLDVSEVGIDKLVEQFDKAYPVMKKFFTEGNEGAKDFLEYVAGLTDEKTGENLNWATQGEDGTWSLDVPVEDLADRMGIGVEAVHAILRKLTDYNIELNVSPAEADLETLKVVAEQANIKLKELDDTTPEFDFNTSNIERANEEIEKAQQTFEKYINEDGTWNMELEGAEDAQEVLAALIRHKQELGKPWIAKMELGDVSGEVGETLRQLEVLRQLKQKLDVQLVTGEDTTGTTEEIEAQISELNPEILATLGIDPTTSVESIVSQFEGLTPEVLVAAGVDKTLVDTWLATDITKSATTVWENDTTEVDKFRSLTLVKTAVVKWISDSSGVEGGGSVDGTAHASGTAMYRGTAMLHGDWSTKQSGRALMGELGPELIVRDGRFFTVGDNGAGFYDYKSGDIIFNAEQTRQLLESGKIRHGKKRGTALAQGTAFAGNTKQSGKTYWDITPVSSSSSSSKKSSSKSSSKSSKKVTKAVDKIKKKYEELIATLEHLIEHQEFLFEQAEVGLDYTGMNDSLVEQARLYKQIMADAQEAIAKMQKKGAKDTNKELQAMEKIYWDAYGNFHDILDDINKLFTDALNDKIDNIQSAYKNLSDAADEFNNSGGITVDTYQDLLENGIQYLDVLDKINGQYVINQEAVEKMIAAEKEQLAVESALSYINSIAAALDEGNTNLIAKLLNGSEKIGDATWNIVYAQAEALRDLGLTNDQYMQIVDNLDALKAVTDQVIANADDGSVEKALENQHEALDKILELTEDMIERETEDRVKAIEEQIEAYREIIELKKEALDATRKQDDYEKDILEKTKEISTLQSRIDILSLDDSREANAERATLIEELKGLQDELKEMQDDHAYDIQTEALDKMADGYEEGRQSEIQKLEDSISSAEKLYQLAVQRIETHWDTLYDELIQWNTAVGNSLNSEITENWNLATEAVKKYGSYIASIEARKANNANASGSSTSTTGSGKNIVVADVNKLPTYHTGGVVGSAGALNAEEVLAVLKQGEIVLADEDQDALWEAIDFHQTLADRLGVALSSIKDRLVDFMPRMFGMNDFNGMQLAADGGGFNFSPSIAVHIEHNGSISDRDATKFGERIANTAIDKLYEAFERRGFNANMSARFRK